MKKTLLAVFLMLIIGLGGISLLLRNNEPSMGWVAAAGICIVALSYLTSILITWRIRKISAYALVTE